jgi:glutamine synthetase
VVFDGDNYSDAWHKEAEKRGLPNLLSTVDALPALKSKESLKLFQKYSVLNEVELAARVDVLYENYTTIIEIEARTLLTMLKTQVIPSALRFQAEVAETVAATHTAGEKCPDTEKQLRELAMISELRAAVAEVEKGLAHAAADAGKHALHVRKSLVPGMARARAASDALEQIMPDDLWPLPTYAEMLFQR